jgi:superfamily I DNA and/or RNA helicase
MFIERSLPSIERSKKVVILGDEKQLSPTNFFISRNTTEELEKYEDDNLIDNKLSLLTYAKAKFPHIMLEHHYRSDYKELIEYSNKIFYNSNLTFITKNNKNIDYQPIEYYQINDPLYKNSLNKKESDKIIEILISIKNAEKFKDKSIGIITMNSRQEKYILEQIASIGFSDLEFAN